MKTYDRRLDRMIFHDWPGVVGSGMHDFVIDEIEVGARAAMALDEDHQWFWALHQERIVRELSEA